MDMSNPQEESLQVNGRAVMTAQVVVDDRDG